MELRHLRYFVTVAEELHFGRAAIRLSIVQPSLSQQIQQLEKELGFPLLYRTKRFVELTDAGKVFLVEAKHVLAQVQEAKRAAQRAYRGEMGRLVVGYISSSTYDLLPMMLRVYRERFPEVEVALRELTTQEQVRALEEEYIQLMKLCLASGFSPNVIQEVTEMHTIVSLVAAGMGVSLVPLSTRNLRSQGVVYRVLEGTTTLTEMAVAWLRNSRSALVTNFLVVARETATSLK